MKSKDSTKEYREMDARELGERYHELTRELFNLRFQSAMVQLSSPARFKKVRRDIARLRTIAKERNLTVR